jgi:nucleoside-diphosphate-sugar epimerase
MKKILILGGGGMIGQKLAKRLLKSGLKNNDLVEVTLFDIAFPQQALDGLIQLQGNLDDTSQVQKLAATRFDIIYHLIAIVSGEAEENFDRGWRTNMFSMWHLLEALRHEHILTKGNYVPKVIFTSSIAVFGGPFPDKIGDEFLAAPQTSYGAQKTACELILSDFSRKGFVDAIMLRLPAICVRPGKANLAASSFFSAIIREPLNGEIAYLPVSDRVRHWHASPRTAANFLVHAATLNSSALRNRRALNLPGVSCTVGEQIEALRDIAGQSTVSLIVPRPDETVIKIVAGWPRDFTPDRAIALGFKAETDFHQIIETYIADDLPHRSSG